MVPYHLVVPHLHPTDYHSLVYCLSLIHIYIMDGLKPVQRRILHSMRRMEDGRYNKVANIVGHTMPVSYTHLNCPSVSASTPPMLGHGMKLHKEPTRKAHTQESPTTVSYTHLRGYMPLPYKLCTSPI